MHLSAIKKIVELYFQRKRDLQAHSDSHLVSHEEQPGIVSISRNSKSKYVTLETMFYLTLSSLQTNTYFANSADPDEMVCNKLAYLDLHCLPFCY